MAEVAKGVAAVHDAIAAATQTLTAAVSAFDGLLGGVGRLSGLFGGGN